MQKKYQVFVSSTYVDLIEARAAATQCLLDNDCIPVGMEQFPASEMSQMEYIKKMLDNCDYYILILGGKYGSLDADGIGFTEKEYDYAVAQKIPIMSFVYDRPEDLPNKFCETTDILREKFKRFREKVCSGRLVKFHSDNGTLKANIVTSIHHCIKDFPAVGWVRGDSVSVLENFNAELLRSMKKFQSAQEAIGCEIAEQKKMTEEKLQQLEKKVDNIPRAGIHVEDMVNEAEAPIVQGIFNAYLSGANTKEICEWLNAQQGSSRKWLRREIDYILMNERYAGNAIFQKKYTTAEMPRTVKRNHGERAMYYVSDSNVPIIPQDVFDCAQELRKRRTVSRSEKPKVYSGKIQCSCGSRCRAKTSNQIWYWSCVVHEEQRNACPVKQVPEETINAAFCRLYYKLKHHGDPIFAQMLSNLQKVRYSRMLWSEDVISLNKKISDTLSQAQFLAQLQQAGGVDPDTFISSNNKLSEQLRRLKQEKARLLDTDSDDLADRTRDLMDALEDGPDFLDSFDAELFDALVEKIIVDSNERLRFRLKNGLELLEQIERTRR